MVENGVLAGDYQGYRIDNNEIQLPLRESCRIQKEIEAQGFRTVRSDSFIPLNKDFIQSYRLIDSINDIQKDVFSALFRGGGGQMRVVLEAQPSLKIATTATKSLMCNSEMEKEVSFGWI